MSAVIFCFVNSGKGTDWQFVVAMDDAGVVLAEHLSSSDSWAKHDIGLTSDWKHERYREAHPDGYTLEWVDSPSDHVGLGLACERNQARRKALACVTPASDTRKPK